MKGSPESHNITQYHLTTWPDYGVPNNTSALVTLRHKVMAKWQEVGGPILVHCSAGVGRTGTFITLDMALEQADQVKHVDIAGIINRLRQQRKLMVQTEVGHY